MSDELTPEAADAYAQRVQNYCDNIEKIFEDANAEINEAVAALTIVLSRAVRKDEQPKEMAKRVIWSIKLLMKEVIKENK